MATWRALSVVRTGEGWIAVVTNPRGPRLAPRDSRRRLGAGVVQTIMRASAVGS
ncbi:hypothetical protein [Nonomuraea guangzhouensis]|uniref:Uncharacterized protein n=1 Tax=Nonomuraea guangzhouensis TaxID=1291555 RepID=A0ABW4G7V0_9ACTN|nr:hypothetical protein [Nonomuraea guangzhouensis]